MNTTVVAKFRESLPQIVEWIDRTITSHEKQAVPFTSLRFPGIPRFFPPNFLARARVVYLPTIPRPPLPNIGVPALADFQKLPFDGITFRDMVFITLKGKNSEPLHLHELTHVAQWDLLGVEQFLLAYGVGLVQQGYLASPLEAMAYMYQTQFTRGILDPRMMDDIRRRTDLIWKAVAPLLVPL